MKQLEIYIHIPFCVKKCYYCDFLSAKSDEGTMHNYVRALIKEIELSAHKMQGYSIRSVFVGGGTPSILEGEWIEQIIGALRDNGNIADDAEITIECNPGTLTREKLASYKDAGINRISLGLQSAMDQELQMLGRIHNWDDFVASYELAREEGFNNINVDLMSALPMQTIESYESTLKKVCEMGPEHISAYSLIVEDDTPLKDWLEQEAAKGNDLLPSEDDERAMYYLTKKVLEQYGYKRYEISNYAKDGYECIHNLGYWDRVDYLGLGIGAASLYQGRRYNNIEELHKYIAFLDEYADVDRLAVDECLLSNNDMMEEFMFLGLRKIAGVSMAEFKEQFGRSMNNVYEEQLSRLKRQGFIEEVGDTIRLTEKGIDVSNIVLANFML